MKRTNSRLIIKYLREKKDTIRANYGANIMGFFGSFARGEQKLNSDIDLLVEFNKEADLINYMALSDHLEKIFGRKVDIVSYPFLRADIKPSVMKELIRL